MRIHPKHTSEVLLQLQKETAYSNEWMLHTPGISVRPDNVDFFKTRKDAIFYNNGNRFGVLAPITSVITILQSIKELEIYIALNQFMYISGLNI